MLRWRNLPRVLSNPQVLGRMIHGSDYPFASNALVFWNRLPVGTLLNLIAEENLFERDLSHFIPVEDDQRRYNLDSAVHRRFPVMLAVYFPCQRKATDCPCSRSLQ